MNEEKKLLNALNHLNNHPLSKNSLMEMESDYLFHYTKSEKAINILFDRKLKLNPLNKMSDPYERDILNFDYNGFDPEKSMIVFSFEDDVNKIRSSSKIVCFCSNNKPKIETQNNSIIKSIKEIKSGFYIDGFANSRMWDQCSDSHRGVCLIFSKAKIIESMKEQFPNQINYCDYVKYTEQFYSISDTLLLNCNEIIEKMLTPNDYISKFKSLIFFTKKIDYCTESEYRIVLLDDSIKCKYLVIHNCIKGVLIGDKCKKEDYKQYKQIADLCSKLGIECATIEWINGIPETWEC